MITVGSHFLDSGAFSLRRSSKGEVDYQSYMDNYAEFIKANRIAIDLYANVDVIGDPELTWQNQKYLEDQHGLSPVPVVHFGTSLRWLIRYIESGKVYIALGGLVGRTAKCVNWLNKCFHLVCQNNLPRIKLHGFGIINHNLLTRYPWFSVDAAAWRIEAGRWASVFVPHRRKGEFTFSLPPYKVRLGRDLKLKPSVPHYSDLSSREKEIVSDWIKECGFEQSPVELSEHQRRVINLYYFERLRNSLPKWPWEFKFRDNGFRKTDFVPSEREFKQYLLKIYYSGGCSNEPERLFGKKSNVMLSFFDLPKKRFQKIIRGRKWQLPSNVKS